MGCSLGAIKHSITTKKAYLEHLSDVLHKYLWTLNVLLIIGFNGPCRS